MEEFIFLIIGFKISKFLCCIFSKCVFLAAKLIYNFIPIVNEQNKLKTYKTVGLLLAGFLLFLYF